MINSRKVALNVLNRVENDGSYSNLLLNAVIDNYVLDDKNRKFVSALVYGVIERKFTLDYQINLYVSKKKFHPVVRNILRLGTYQILFMDRVPDSAAVNESVKLAYSAGLSFSVPMINAVLRKISAHGIVFPDKTDDDYYKIKYSLSGWIVDLWKESYGSDNFLQILDSVFNIDDYYIRVNNLKISDDLLLENLNSIGIRTEFTGFEHCLRVVSSSDLTNNQYFKEGLYHIQDLSSQLAVHALSPQKGDIVLDVCSAPGGKTFSISESLKNSGLVYSCDLFPNRLNLVQNGVNRLGLENVKLSVNDGTVYNKALPLFDRVLCDVPCSGLGVIRKKPEIRYKDKDEVSSLYDIQYTILSVSSKYLKKGGTLVYSTCTLNPNENELILNKFLNEHNDFHASVCLPFIKRPKEDKDYLTLLPYVYNSDGFFIATLTKD